MTKRSNFKHGNHPIPTDKASLLRRIKQIFSLGWIDLTRTGPTGAGKTWEDHLGINENNLRLPDIGNIEIKVLEEKGSSALTLVSRALPYEALLNHGITKADVLKFRLFRTNRDYVTRNLVQTGTIYYNVSKESRTVDWYLKPNRGHHILLACWPLADLFSKTSWLCITFYSKKSRNIGYGQMLPTRCYLLKLSNTRLMQLIDKGQLYCELRAHFKSDGSIRDHGSAWRINRAGLRELLRNRKPVATTKFNY